MWNFAVATAWNGVVILELLFDKVCLLVSSQQNSTYIPFYFSSVRCAPLLVASSYLHSYRHCESFDSFRMSLLRNF